eukprot:TRINITY_DN173_c0_g1_i1.p1 TRINITY_DN173_c0_g1~~TRINITY_DN173_c0_g1_i1.p1  ORF type:complete len:263 (+),score=32.69 TRINITY_DN173_c0_g1_i1:282-1070(+)
MSELIEHLLIDETFSSLRPYLSGFKLRDLIGFGEETLATSVPIEHQLRMRLFWRTKIVPNFAAPRYQVEFSSDGFFGPIAPLYRDGVLVLNGCLVTDRCRFPNDLRTCTSGLKDLVTQYTRTVHYLELGSCELHDEDMQYILQAVKSRSDIKFVGLRNNEFRCDYEPFTSQLQVPLKEMLGLEHVQYVDVAANAFVHVRQQQLLQELDRNSLCKLIFVPEMWLDAGSDWRKLLGDKQTDEELVDAVLCAHNKFYREVYNHHA